MGAPEGYDITVVPSDEEFALAVGVVAAAVASLVVDATDFGGGRDIKLIASLWAEVV